VTSSLDRALTLVVLSTARDQHKTPPPSPSDVALIAACRRGERGAMEKVFRAHAEALARLLTRIVGPSIDVEDLLQETFAEAITAFPRFRGETSLRTWLHRIAIHVAHQHLRRPRQVREELREVEAALADGDREGAGRELRAQHNAVTSVARHLDVPAELALRGATDRFVARARRVEAAARASGRALDQLTPEEIDRLWQQAKGEAR